MTDGTRRILLIEDNPAEARQVERVLMEAGGFRTQWIERMSAALSRLVTETFDCILVDLSLPDARGLEALGTLRSSSPLVAILALSSADDESMAMESITRGVDDYVVKGPKGLEILPATVGYLIERNRARQALRNTTVDALTGLPGRRQFISLAHEHVARADRANKGFWLLTVDVEGLAELNAALGRIHGDQALIDLATILQCSFRSSDVVARVGGDEFCVLLPVESEHGRDAAVGRLRDRVLELNGRGGRAYRLSVVVGTSRYTPGSGDRIEDLMRRADRSLYQDRLVQL